MVTSQSRSTRQISPLAFKMGWVDLSGNSIDWKVYQRARKKIYYVFEEVEEADAEFYKQGNTFVRIKDDRGRGRR